MKSNFILLLALIFILSRRKDDSIKNVLSSISTDDALTVLKYLGIDETVLNAAVEILPDLTSGKADFSSVIKKVLPLIISFGAKNKEYGGTNDDNRSYDETSPVGSFIPDEIKKDLDDYFA